MEKHQNINKEIYNIEDQDLLKRCRLCPRECGTDRFRRPGAKCKTDAGLNISSICLHKGEEPAISGADGICNIFFAGCNLHCLFCQNHEISRKGGSSEFAPYDLKAVIDCVCCFLDMGVRSVGFVSPSHVVPQVRAIINGIRARNYNPVTVYNTNSYDKPETLRSLSDLIDVYLPDFKYASAEIAGEYSNASDYPEVALKALKEMFYQKGSTLQTDENGIAEKGIILRHLVLPGKAEESIKVLRLIADEVSTGIHLSLMSQYYPTEHVKNHPFLNRKIFQEEYSQVVNEMERLGFRNGYVQEMNSFENYRPDFSRENPFE